MKIFVAATLFFVGFAVTTVNGRQLLNGGQILSADGKYIPGKFSFFWESFFKVHSVMCFCDFLFILLCCFEFTDILIVQWTPIFEELKSYVQPDGIGYIDIQLHLQTDTNESLETHNRRLLQLLYKVFGDLFEKQIPYIQNKRLRAIYAQAVEGNKQQEEELKRGHFNLDSINLFFTIASNNLNDFLNSHRK